MRSQKESAEGKAHVKGAEFHGLPRHALQDPSHTELHSLSMLALWVFVGHHVYEHQWVLVIIRRGVRQQGPIL